jgi:protein TonB
LKETTMIFVRLSFTAVAAVMMLLGLAFPLAAQDTIARAPSLTVSDQNPQKEPPPATVLDEQPEVVKRTMPVYPKSALEDSTEGTVYLRVTIDEHGAVGDVAVQKSARKDLDDAAVDCMKQWQFIPGKLKGKAVPATVMVPFRFKLTKGPVPGKAK